MSDYTEGLHGGNEPYNMLECNNNFVFTLLNFPDVMP